MGAAVGVGDLEGVVGEEFGVPGGAVEEVVVAAADEDEVVEGGGPAPGHPADVMCLTPVGGRSQPGKRQWRSRITRAL